MPTLTEDRDAIRELIARYCHSIDSGASDEWAATFTEDAEFLGAGEPLVGRDALRSFAAAIPAGALHHMVVNEVIEIDGDAATVRSSVLVTAKGTIVTTGRGEDELRRVDGQWRIHRRNYLPDAL